MYSFWLDLLILLYGLLDCSSLVKCCRLCVRNQQTCCFVNFSVLSSPCCIVFWGVVNKGYDLFWCPRWYRQGIVSDDRLGFVVDLLEAVLTCIVKCAKCMRLCVVSMTMLLFLIKCNLFIGLVIFFITTKCWAKTLCPISNLNVAVANGFSNWPLATFVWKLLVSAILQRHLVDWFLQVWNHFGIYEVLDDRLSGDSEYIFC